MFLPCWCCVPAGEKNTEATYTVKYTVMHCVQSVLRPQDGLLLPVEAKDVGRGTELDPRTRGKRMEKEGGGWEREISQLAHLDCWF